MGSCPLRGATCLLQGFLPSGKTSSREEKIRKSNLSLPAGVRVGLGEGSLAVMCALALHSASRLQSWCCRAYEDLSQQLALLEHPQAPTSCALDPEIALKAVCTSHAFFYKESEA